jgi:hypothetical protein
VSYPAQSVPDTIYLSPNLYELAEVKVYPIDIKKIVEGFLAKAQADIKGNLNRPGKFFYRQTTQTDSVCNELLEAFFTSDYVYSVHDLNLQGGRFAKLKGDSVNVFNSLRNFFINSQVTPLHTVKPGKTTVIVPFQPGYEKYYTVSVEAFYENGNPDVLYKMFFKAKSNVKRPIVEGELCIDPVDYIITRYQGMIKNMPLTVDTKGASYKDFLITFSVSYKIKRGTSFVEAVNVSSSYKTILPFKTQQVKVNSLMYLTEEVASGKGQVKLKQGATLVDKIEERGYVASIWQDNPIVKRTPLEENAISIFEKSNLFGTYIQETSH